jgi:hypothetical protein
MMGGVKEKRAVKWITLLLTHLVPVVPIQPGEPGALLPPVHIHAGAGPLDVERDGHAAPFVGDFFEDGTMCLLVGQYHEGRLRIYRNGGTRTKPKFDKYTWFEAGGKIASVPVG